jgi:radical SAM enzyme (TIGR01210 family)
MKGARAGVTDKMRHRDRDAAVSVWREKEHLAGRTVDAGVVILRTSGCSHFHSGGCSMCGYNVESDRSVSGDDITRQFTGALERLGDVRMLKVYTSGSFLDEGEVQAHAAERILKECSDRGVRLLVESRPEYVTEDNLDRIVSHHDDIEVAIGLESANDQVLKYSINKGFTVADYDRAASLLKKREVGLRTYVLLKPPFLTEKEAIEDAVATAKRAAPFSRSISVNAVNVQKGTLVERLWKDWSYRPPWLWSALDVVERTAGLGPRMLCEPVGGGTQRGAHNCGECDRAILDGLKAFTESQDLGRLARPDCECSATYSAVLGLEGSILGGTPDLERFFRQR